VPEFHDANGHVTWGELRPVLARYLTRSEFHNEYWAKVRPGLEFYELMTEKGLRELLPLMLDDENARRALRTAATTNWAKWRRRAVVAGLCYTVLQIGLIVAVFANTLARLGGHGG
jgi:hypothetical protein